MTASNEPRNIKTIGICAPSSRMNPDTFALGLNVIQNKGYEIFVHPQCYEHTGQIAGEAPIRAAALMDVLTNPAIDAVWLMGGGHRAAEVLPLLDWDLLAKTPQKPVMGFSDGSIIIYALNARLGWITYFGPTVQTLGRLPDQWTNAEAALLGKAKPIPCTYDEAAVEGRIIASTLSLVPLLIDTIDMPQLEGAILCIEDTNEELTTIDRHLLYLKRRDVFPRLRAIVCGSFTNMVDSGRPFGFTLEEIVRHHSGGVVPVAMDAAFGHGDVFYPLPVGGTARLAQNALTFI